MYRTVLFDQNSTDVESPVFYVLPGFVSLISVFGLHTAFTDAEGNLANLSCITIQKVLVNGMVLPQIEAGCNNANLQEVIDAVKVLTTTREEDVMQFCKPWSISPCENYKILSVPGSYRLTLADEQQLGEFYVEQVSIPVDQAILFPQGMFLGN